MGCGWLKRLSSPVKTISRRCRRAPLTRSHRTRRQNKLSVIWSWPRFSTDVTILAWQCSTRAVICCACLAIFLFSTWRDKLSNGHQITVIEQLPHLATDKDITWLAIYFFRWTETSKKNVSSNYADVGKTILPFHMRGLFRLRDACFPPSARQEKAAWVGTRGSCALIPMTKSWWLHALESWINKVRQSHRLQHERVETSRLKGIWSKMQSPR